MAHNALTEAERQANWKLLFDGKTLQGWKNTGRPEGWKVSDEAIMCTVQRGGYIYTEEQFEDFDLSLEFKIAPKTNSGIFLRWSDLSDPVNTGLEIQVLDSFGVETLTTHSCGAIYDLVVPSEHAFKPAGEWNQVLITCDGPLVSVTLNGKKIAEMDMDKWTQAGLNPDGSKNKFTYAWADMPRLGHIGLQDHGGMIWYRNLKLRPL
ncbi:MAG: 3-keto-disaccharide hydrolase [Limnochordia bacterium]|jgi:hypothetical protein